ncbi:bifunctional serine/threonine-protein kinase/formylglycine-generating enzyme family protein [Sorangium sp. So ce375]|uniref:SUMF1/EgtB/PvdO family nonheme iron enzyme n=1 Tax=Sorangium sp. So ce375 TaxID=3133306 RepID=UPI003F5BA783
MAEPSDDPFGLSGQTIEGKYRVAAVIGDGGFGVVYRGMHEGFGELIAIKCLKLPTSLDIAERDALLETLRGEGRILHRLSRATSGIVQALDVGAFTTQAGVWVPYLVLEWLEGQTLGQYLRDRRERGEAGMSIAEAIQLLTPAARALAVAHAHKVAHRDVKPANLFLTHVGGARTLKVLDFGIAKVLSDHPTFTEALAATRQGPSAFTPRYGAPEQFNKARGATGPWTDVFALALIFVELVSGKRALEGDDPTQLYIASADPAVRPTLRARGLPEAPEAIERVLDKALAIEPKHRFTSAGEFWDALSAAASGERAGALAGRGAPSAEHAAGLSTAEYAAAQGLGVAVGPSEPTMLADAHAPAPARPAVVKVSHGGNAPANAGMGGSPAAGATGGAAPRTGGAAAAAAGALATGGSRTAQVEDSMIETVAPARHPAAGAPPPHPGAAAHLPPAAGGPPHAAPPHAAPPYAAPPYAAPPYAAPPHAAPPHAAPPVAAPPRRRSTARAALPWFVAALVLGGAGATAYVLTRAPEKKPARAPAARTTAASSAGHAPTAAAVGAALATAAPTASASAPAPSAAPAEPAAPPADMVFIGPISTTIGAAGEARQVTLTRGFYIDRNEVTVRAYRACMQQRMCGPADHVSLTPELLPGAKAPAAPEEQREVELWTRRCNEPRNATGHPINCVDYSQAESYCRFRGRRLPTEAEWEVAARGAAGRAFVWGDDAPTCERACYDRNEGCLARGTEVATCASGAHPSDRTPEGIYDLAGNVSEWVSDGLVFPPPGGENPQGDPSFPLKVVRGGSFLDGPEKLSATYRTAAAPVTAHAWIGFRCAMDAPAQDGAAAQPPAPAQPAAPAAQ